MATTEMATTILPMSHYASVSSCTGGSITFRGRVVARNLPVDVGTMEQVARNKPSGQYQAVDPSSLVQGLGPLHYRPETNKCRLIEKDKDQNIVNKNRDQHQHSHLEESINSNSDSSRGTAMTTTILELYLYPSLTQQKHKEQQSTQQQEAEAQGQGTASTLLLQLNRQSDEPLQSTLKRLELNLQKKLKTLQRDAAGRRKQKQQQEQSMARQQQQQQPKVAVWKLVATKKTSDDTAVQLEEWKSCLAMPNYQVWQEAAAAQQQQRWQLVISLDIQEEEESGGGEEIDNNDSDNTTLRTRRLYFWVEANTPLITAVQTFQDFGARVFVGIPLVIQTSCCFGNHVRVDWYTVCKNYNNQKSEQLQLVRNGRDGGVEQQHETAATMLVQSHHSSCYIPQPQDVGKRLFVVLTPTSSFSQHDGAGCQEAYKFEYTVEERPENRILQLRSTGTTRRPGATHCRKDWVAKEISMSRTTATTIEHKNQDSDIPDGNNDENNRIIRIMTYNILADQNAFDHYRHRPSCGPSAAPGGKEPDVVAVAPTYVSYMTSELMDKKRRAPLILHELLSYRADVICLQEVDTSVYQNLLRPVLKHFNYQGFFSCKKTTPTTCTKKTNGNDGKDDDDDDYYNSKTTSINSNEGCAIFWSLDKFEPIPETNDENLQDRYTYLIQDLFPSCLEKWQKDNNDSSREWKSMTDILQHLEQVPNLDLAVRKRLGHVVQMVPLQLIQQHSASSSSHANNKCKLPKRMLIVSNTHLYFQNDASHVRVLQTYVIAHQLYKLQKQLQHQQESNRVAICVCGDFNSGLRDAGGLLLVEGNVAKCYEKLQRHFYSFRYDDENDITNGSDNNSSASSNGNAATNSCCSSKTTPTNILSPPTRFPIVCLPDSFPTLTSALNEYPPVTHFIPGFVGTLDHILVRTQELMPLGNAPMPTLEYLSRDTAMPSAYLPSDHVSLVADLEFVSSDNGDDDKK